MLLTHITYIANVAAACSTAVASAIHGVPSRLHHCTTCHDRNQLLLYGHYRDAADQHFLSPHINASSWQETQRVASIAYSLGRFVICFWLLPFLFDIISVAIVRFQRTPSCTTSQACQHRNGWHLLDNVQYS